MEQARLPLPGSTGQRSQALLVAALLALAFVGWAVTDERMNGMDAGPGTDLGTFGFFVSAWVVMMAAMMFPSIWPMVTIYRRVQEGKRSQDREAPIGATAIFVAGYLVTWTAAGLVAYVAFEALQSLPVEAFSWDRGGPYLAGTVILLAGAYQLTPFKDVCLSKCRSPLMFVLTSWQRGRLGALRMGIEHGAWCVGCCWALMAALFALGVMSLGWMLFIAALIAIEKLLPWKAVANRSIAILLVVLGLAVAFAPERVPGLILPDSPQAAQAMEAMGMDEGGSMPASDRMQGSGTGSEQSRGQSPPGEARRDERMGSGGMGGGQ